MLIWPIFVPFRSIVELLKVIERLLKMGWNCSFCILGCNLKSLTVVSITQCKFFVQKIKYFIQRQNGSVNYQIWSVKLNSCFLTPSEFVLKFVSTMNSIISILNHKKVNHTNFFFSFCALYWIFKAKNMPFFWSAFYHQSAFLELLPGLAPTFKM